MMLTKFSPVLAILLLAGAEISVPSTARSAEAKAATLDESTLRPVHVRCFMGQTSNRSRMMEFHSEPLPGWVCMPEVRPALTAH